MGALHTFEAKQVLRGFPRLNVVVADVVDDSPPFDTGGMMTLNGIQMMFELWCLFAERRGSFTSA